MKPKRPFAGIKYLVFSIASFALGFICTVPLKRIPCVVPAQAGMTRGAGNDAEKAASTNMDDEINQTGQIGKSSPLRENVDHADFGFAEESDFRSPAAFHSGAPGDDQYRAVG